MDKAEKHYPYGQLNEEDEGELGMAIWIESSAVRIQFAKPVTWLAMPPVQARALGQLLLKHAATIENGMQ